jgi:hypothetical protein
MLWKLLGQKCSEFLKTIDYGIGVFSIIILFESRLEFSLLGGDYGSGLKTKA